MTTISKKLTACLLSVVMLLGMLLMMETAHAATISGGSTIADAASINLNTAYSDSTSLNQEKNWYRFTLPSSGRVSIDFTSKVSALTLRIYNSDADDLWDKYCSKSNDSGQLTQKQNLDLTKGTYYLCVERYYTSEQYIGSYTLQLNFTSAGESFTETGYGTNNTYQTASAITMGNTYVGQLAYNDEFDWYRFTLPSSGRIKLDFSAKISGSLSLRIYNDTTDELWSSSYYGDSATGQMNKNLALDLTKGTYYICIKRTSVSNGYTGNYTLKTAFTSAKESFTETGYGTNNTYQTANTISLNKAYVGQLAHNDKYDWYRFTLPSSGRISLNLTSKIDAMYVRLYNGSAEQIDYNYYSSNSGTGQMTENDSWNLVKGTYYLCMEKYSTSDEYSGNYNFKLAFTSAKESFSETVDKNNNTYQTANTISLGNSYTGHLAYNDEYDWYRVTLPSSGRVILNFTSQVDSVNVRLYSSDAEQLWYKYLYRSSGTGQIANTITLDLTKGTYYLCVERYSNSLKYTGAYTFKTTFTSAEESFTETGYGNNNTMDSADSVSLGINYKGQIACNDDKDFYKFKMPAKGKLNLYAQTKMDSVTFYFYDRNGNQLLVRTAYKSSSVGTNSPKITVSVPAGTVYMSVVKNGTDNTGAYTFSVQRDGVPTAPQVTPDYVASSGKPYLKWASVEYASKYEVYRSTSKTGTYKKIATTSKASYTDTSATTGYTYYYKVKAISSKGSASGYSAAVSAISHCAKPVVKPDYLTSTGKPYVKWSAVTGASKYEVYRATSKTGTYKLLGTTTKLNYTDTSATTGYTYYYKVKAVSKVKTSANSAYSTPISIVCHCAKPVVKITTSSGDPRLTWSTVTGASKYEVYRATSSGGTYTKVATTTAKTYTDKTAKAGKTYYYKVKAVSKVKTSANSAYSAVKSIKAK